jgi:pimeloyl-ACP methyl ester carboxylesterase
MGAAALEGDEAYRLGASKAMTWCRAPTQRPARIAARQSRRESPIAPKKVTRPKKKVARRPRARKPARRAAPTHKPAFTEQFYQSSDGLRLYYRTFGRPAAAQLSVLCLPGLTRNSRDFESLAAHLASYCFVITPDLRGRGRSEYDADWRNYHPRTYADDALRLLNTLAVSSCVVIGTSLGGLVGMILAAFHAPRVDALVLNDIGPVLDPRGVARIREYAGKVPPVRNWAEAVKHSRTRNEQALPGLSDQDWLAMAKRTYREMKDGGLRPDVDPNIARAINDPRESAFDLWPLYGALRSLPMLVLRGALSDLLSPETLERMRELKPDLHTLIVANRGHAPTLDEPEARATIDEFLAGLVAARKSPQRA